MMGRHFVLLLALLAASVMPAAAGPDLAVQNGYKCNVCHVNPTGGGLRNDFGVLYAKALMPVDTLKDAAPGWSGRVADAVRVGGDLRADWQRNEVPETGAQHQCSPQQLRLYADVAIIPNRLGVYADEQVAPNAAQTMEAYVRYGNPAGGVYLKGGKFYLPFGWRLQDQTAFAREATGISAPARWHGSVKRTSSTMRAFPAAGPWRPDWRKSTGRSPRARI